MIAREKRIVQWIVFCLLIGFVAQGEPKDRENVRHQRTSVTRENWISKRVMSKEFMEKSGIQGDQAKKLKVDFDILDAQSAKLNDEIKQAAARQGEIAKKVLSESGANVDELMKIIEQIGKCRTEQAKIATRRLVAIRDNLTPEQREKASALLNEEKKKEHDTRERKNQVPNRPVTPKG